MYSLAWIVTAMVLIFIELITISTVCIWFIIGTLAAFGVSYLTNLLWVQILVFAVVSFLAYLITNFVLASRKTTTKIYSDSIVGKVGKVTKKIKENESGEVEVADKKWVAYSNNEIAVGKKVRVLAVDGNKLLVDVE